VSFSGQNDDENDDGSEKLTQDQELLQYARQMDDDGVPDPIKRQILAERERMPGTGVKVALTTLSLSSVGREF
jgi:hypothetical protein